MKRHYGSKLIFLGFFLSLICEALCAIPSFRIPIRLPIAIINLISIVSFLIIMLGFIFKLKYNREPLLVATAALFFITVILNFLGIFKGFSAGGIESVITLVLFNAYLIPWMIRMKNTNILVALMLLGAFVWNTVVYVGFALILGGPLDASSSPIYLIYTLISLGVQAVPALAAFVDMNCDA